MHGVHDPVDTRVAADGLVGRVHHDDLEVLVRGVLSDPVRVQHTQVATGAAGAHLSQGLAGLLPLELSNTLVLGLTVGLTLGHGALAATTAHAHAVHHEACGRGKKWDV